MEYKISYGTYHNPFNGTNFNQRINVYMTNDELIDLNGAVKSYKESACKNSQVALHLHEFHKGYNYATISQSTFFALFFKFLTSDKRFKQDRNTFIDIRIKLGY